MPALFHTIYLLDKSTTKSLCKIHDVFTFEPPHDKTNEMACAPSKDSDQPGQCAQWVAKGPSFLHADSDDSDQNWRMPRLI